jgi:alpha-glucuronidase
VRPPDDDGYRLWLRYEPIRDGARRAKVAAAFRDVELAGTSAVLAAARDELLRGVTGLAGVTPNFHLSPGARAAAGTRAMRIDVDAAAPLGPDGFVIGRDPTTGAPALAGRSELGVLYGVFHLLRQLQLGRSLTEIDAASAPRYPLRMLDHWDNLDGSIERGYAGTSLWWGTDWDRPPARVADYARACASIGINAAALNNVNADPRVLTAARLAKVAALADVLRPWGVRAFLSARFSAPIELGGLPTADPADARVAAWWRAKADEIYALIPDFGGFVVKANSEGQPGPQDYGRSHADGANLLADALAPRGGRVIWRAFVYRADVAEDRAKQAYTELAPLDGAFRSNVLVQIKNGPIDFQPREPFHPLFGAMPRTAQLLEVQLAQEYLGFATHLAYLGPMFRETLDADTYAAGPGSTVTRAIAGMVAVANTGSDRNWCGHPFAQANWYAFGRLAWDPTLGAAAVAREWLQLTFGDDARVIATAERMMMASREVVVDYMTPLGLHHLMAKDHHYGPGPWVDAGDTGRADWSAVYYHRADSDGIGFDRSPSGSDAVSQYRSPLRERYGDPAHCPENLLLWFHHLSWDHPMRSGRTLWDELCQRYTAGAAAVRDMQAAWDALEDVVDPLRFADVRARLAIQADEAWWWRNACLLYFQTSSRRPLPAGLPALEGTLQQHRDRTPLRGPGI